MPDEVSEGTRSLNLKTVSQRVTKVHSEVIVLGFFQDVRPLVGLAADIDWIYDGILSRLILGRKIQGGMGETTLLAAQKKCSTQKILLIGLGVTVQFRDKDLRDVYGRICETLTRLHVRYCAMELFGRTDTTQEGIKAVDAMVRSLRKDPDRWMDISVIVPDPERAQRIQQHIQTLAGTE